jgi:hypothetical protein
VTTGVGLGESRAPDAFVIDVRMGDADLAALWGAIQFYKFKLFLKIHIN